MDNYIEIIGYLGTLIMACNGMPQLYKTLKTKNVESLSLGMLFCWAIGGILLLTYVALSTRNIPLLINYTINILVPATLLYLYFKYRRKS
jgi:MtN3 and saliva related transmembrane protein